MTENEHLAIEAFTRAADEFMRAQELVHEAGHPIRAGLLELLKASSEKVVAALEQLVRLPGGEKYHAWRYRDMTFLLVPRGEAFALAVIPEAQVMHVNRQ
jgi:hypothetical protein